MADSNAKKLAQLLDSNGDVRLSNLDNISTDLVDDTTPQLGGDLDGNGNTIDLSGSTDAQKTPVGTTAQRSTEAAGAIRFNTTTSLMEYYDGNGWIKLSAPPSVTSISPSTIADSDSSVDIVITGEGFTSGATVKAIGQDASEISAGTVTVNSSTQITANFDGTSFDDAQEDYDIKVTADGGLTGILDDCLSVNASPAWTVASGSLGSIYDSARSSLSFTTGATDAEGATLTYSVSVGSLPTGLTLNTSTGTITGSTSAVGSDTTTTFTLSVTDGTNTNTRQYSITQKAPVVVSYTSSSGSFSVPSGTTAVDVLVVAGGGSGAHGGSGDGAGGGGAGGLIYRPAYPVTPGGTVSYSVGSGGSPKSTYSTPGSKGQDSTFGTLTAKGGGGGTKENAPYPEPATSGGSGGGYGAGGYAPGYGIPTANGGAQNATQPSQPGDSGTYGFGYGGGGAYGEPSQPGGGGGGAGGGGEHGSGKAPQGGGAGGPGKSYSISGSSVTYAAGGRGNVNTGTSGDPGTANRGNGGRAVGSVPNSSGAGGSGIVIVAY